MPFLEYGVSFPTTGDDIGDTLTAFTRIRDISLTMDEDLRRQGECPTSLTILIPPALLDVAILRLEMAKRERDALVRGLVSDVVKQERQRRGRRLAVALGILVGALLVIATMTGCSTSDPVNADDSVTALKNLRYVWDPGKRLCFATLKFSTYGGHQGISLAHVPDSACGQ